MQIAGRQCCARMLILASGGATAQEHSEFLRPAAKKTGSGRLPADFWTFILLELAAANLL
jgi:hypothetical protein